MNNTVPKSKTGGGAKTPYYRLVLVLLLIAAVVPFLNTFQNDFVGYDDQTLIENNRTIRDISPGNILRMFTPRQRGGYQPIRTLSYAIDYAVWGGGPFGFHLTNIVLHALSVVGVWFLARLLLNESAALITALIFAVHPIHVESVTWLSGRKDVLSLTFFLLAILMYERSSSSRTPAWYIGSILATGMAMLSKLTAVALPPCILLLEICREGWPDIFGWRRKLVRLLPHVGVVCLIVVVNFVGTGTTSSHGDPISDLEQQGGLVHRDVWLSMPLVVCRYLGLLILPYRLSTHYDVARVSEIMDVRLLLPMLALIGLAGLGIVSFLRRRMTLAFCIGWFFITFLPTSNIVPTAAMMVDRYMHAPSLGFAMLLAAVLAYPFGKESGESKAPSRLVSVLPIVLIILIFCTLTVRRNADWRNTATLFTRTLQVNPRSVDAHLAMGTTYNLEGDYESAINMYRKALDVEPGNYRVLYNLGVAYVKKGWFHQAISVLEDSRDANPGYLPARFNLALAYHKQRRYSEALAEHEAVLKMNPNRAASLGDIGRIHMEMGDYGLALENLNRSLEVSPDLVPALMDRAKVLAHIGRQNDSENDLKRLETLEIDTRSLREELSMITAAQQGPTPD